MTGRRLYDALTDAWADQGQWGRDRSKFLSATPLAWAFLHSVERATFNAAARKLTPRKAKP